jgi:hypothetical protein
VAHEAVPQQTWDRESVAGTGIRVSSPARFACAIRAPVVPTLRKATAERAVAVTAQPDPVNIGKLDVERARREFGFTAGVELEDGLRKAA